MTRTTKLILPLASDGTACSIYARDRGWMRDCRPVDDESAARYDRLVKLQTDLLMRALYAALPASLWRELPAAWERADDAAEGE